MAIRDVVTMGFGSWQTTISFIPTLGYTPSNVVTVAGPYYIDAAQVFAPGSVAHEVYVAGAAAGQVFAPGAVAAEVTT